MGTREDRYVDYFYEMFKGRIAIGAGYAQDLVEIFPFVFEEGEKALGIVAIAPLSNRDNDGVHIFHLSAFKPRGGSGSAMLKKLCLEADRQNVTLSLSPIPSPNGEADQINSAQLLEWYRQFGFKGDSRLSRRPSKGFMPPQTL